MLIKDPVLYKSEADSGLLSEWQNRHLPLKTAKMMDSSWGVFGNNRFHTGQPVIGVIVLLIYGLALILAYYVDNGLILIGIPVLFYEWITLKPRTMAYNRRLWNELVEKWNPETKLQQPEGT